MDITKFKQGQEFSAKIEKVPVRGHIFVSNEVVWFCHDEERQDGANAPDKLGHKYSWYATKDSSEITCIKTTEKCVPVDYKKIKIIAEWNFEIKSNKAIFGCGEVIIPVSQIKAFVAITKILKEREITLSNLDWEVLKAHF